MRWDARRPAGAQHARVQSMEDAQLESDTVAAIEAGDDGVAAASTARPGYPQPSAAVRLAAAKAGNGRKVFLWLLLVLCGVVMRLHACSGSCCP